MNDKISNFDQGWKDDAIGLIIELLHTEWHSFKSYIQSKDITWLSINKQARLDRTHLMEIVCDKYRLMHDGELWCFSKHCLKSVGFWVELGNRMQTSGDNDKAKHYYEKAGQWLGAFLLKNNLVNYKEVESENVGKQL